MFILFTVCFNEYVGNRWTYFLYIALIDFFYSGFSIIHPKVYLRCYGHKNIVLVHGACKLLEIPAILLQSGMTPWLVENFSYFSLFSVVNTFSLISKHTANRPIHGFFSNLIPIIFNRLATAIGFQSKRPKQC